MCALLRLVCVGEDASLKCCTSAHSQAAWEHTDHMHSNVGRPAVLMTGERPFSSAHLVWLGSCSLDSAESAGVAHSLNPGTVQFHVNVKQFKLSGKNVTTLTFKI